MEKAEKMTKKEISCLPWGAVVWVEGHRLIDCGLHGNIDAYTIFPALVTETGENGYLYSGDKTSYEIIEISEIETDKDKNVYWNKQPEPEQMERGIKIEDALEIFNKYEAEELHLK